MVTVGVCLPPVSVSPVEPNNKQSCWLRLAHVLIGKERREKRERKGQEIYLGFV